MQEPKQQSNSRVFVFVAILCFVCALLLSVAAHMLEKPQRGAKEFDQSKQMLIAAKILDHNNYFEILDENGKSARARFDPLEQVLIADPQAQQATDEEITLISKIRIRPLVTDSQGNIFTLEEKKIILAKYLATHKTKGYAHLPFKLFYVVLPNQAALKELSNQEITTSLEKMTLFVIPVSGFGLWAPIYGFIAINPQTDLVIGTTWYEHGETPGLGANITAPWWQKQFYGKYIFQQSEGKIDYQTAEMGIIVVKGRVKDLLGNSPKAKSAVDGMSGATLTGDGVTQAYRNSLTPYRALFIKIRQNKKDK